MNILSYAMAGLAILVFVGMLVAVVVLQYLDAKEQEQHDQEISRRRWRP